MPPRNSYAASNAQARAELARNGSEENPLPPGLPVGKPLFHLPAGTPVHTVNASLSRKLIQLDALVAGAFYVTVEAILDGRMHDPTGRKIRTTVNLKSRFRIGPVEGEVKHVFTDMFTYARTTFGGTTMHEAKNSALAEACVADLVDGFCTGTVSLWDAVTSGAKVSLDRMERQLADRARTIASMLERGDERRAEGYQHEMEQAQERAGWAAEDLAMLSRMRDARLGIATEDAQRSAQRAARLIDERATMAEEHQRNVAEARKRQEAASSLAMARLAHAEVLERQAPEMYSVIRALREAGLPLDEAMRARLDAIVAALTPTDPEASAPAPLADRPAR